MEDDCNGCAVDSRSMRQWAAGMSGRLSSLARCFGISIPTGLISDAVMDVHVGKVLLPPHESGVSRDFAILINNCDPGARDCGATVAILYYCTLFLLPLLSGIFRT